MGARAEAVSPSRKKRGAAKKKSASKPRRRVTDQEVDALRNEVLGIAIAVGSLAMLLSLISFYPEDVANTGTAAVTGRTHNLIGPVGATIADIILQIAGLAGFLVPISLVVPGLCFMTGRRLRIRPVDAISFPTLLICCAMAAHLWLDGRPVLGHGPGGWIGEHGAEILRSFFGTTGTYLLIYSLLALTFVMSTGISLIGILGKLARPVYAWFLGKCRRVGGALKRFPSRLWEDVTEIWAGRRQEREKKVASTPKQPKITDRRKSLKKEAKSEVTAPTKVIQERDEAHSERPKKKGLFGFARSPSGRPADSGEFVLGDLSVDGGVTKDTGEVLNADDVGAEFDDPIDRAAFEGTTDTTMASRVSSVSPDKQEVVAAPAKPIVNRRRSKEAPAEQIEIPLPGSLKCEDYRFPPLHFLDYDDSDQVEVDPGFLQEQAQRLVDALRTFKIEGRVTEIHPGPVVTMYEFEPAPGVRISRIAGLADDLAMALKAFKVRIVAPIPGKGVVGFEVPSQNREMVFLKEIIGSKTFQQKKHNLPMVLGKDIHGEPMVTDLSKMPHLLVAGTTGSGKSVGVNCMITSLLYHSSPEECRFIMVDPKMLELSIYEGIPHLLLPVVTDPKKAAMALKWAVDEMERRYEVMKNAGVRDLRGYNRKVEKEIAEAEAAQLRARADALEAHESAGNEGDSVADIKAIPLPEDLPQKIPYLVVVIDEFADLMMVAGKEVELCVARIAQKARAAGIHLILATQRPSTDVITGVIKANFPTRIAFQVSSAIDSRTILSTNGAESLLGKGDMLFMPPGSSKLTRVHGAFVSETEIHGIVEFIGSQASPEYLDESVLMSDDEKDDLLAGDDGDMDAMYDEAVRVVARDGRASTSHLQRRLSLGYNRAARIVDQMERDGLVGPSRGAKAREVNYALINQLVARWDGLADDAPIDLM